MTDVLLFRHVEEGCVASAVECGYDSKVHNNNKMIVDQ